MGASLRYGEQGARVLDSFFRHQQLIVKATRQHERQGVDRFFILRSDARVVHRVDYKTDQRAGTTGRLAIEHVSVFSGGRIHKQGWIHTTVADLIVCYVPISDKAYMIETSRLRAIFDDALRLFPLKRCATILNDRRLYETWSCCIPIEWLRQNQLFKHEWTIGQLQLSL